MPLHGWVGPAHALAGEEGASSPARDIVPADKYGLAQLARLFTLAYEGYAFKVEVDDRALGAFVRERSVDLHLSRAMIHEHDPFGVSFLARRGQRGYLAAIGIVARHRAEGLGRALLDASLDALRAAGATTVTLDVLEDNAPARRLYERAGFRTRRLLPCYRIPELVARNVDLREVPAESLLPRVRADVAWQNERESIVGAQARAFAIDDAGFAFVKATPRGIIVYDVGGPDPARVIDGLGGLFPRSPASFVNVTDTRVEEALRARGWERFVTQHEMEMRLDRP